MLIDRPGNITIDNCAWIDMTAPMGVLLLNSTEWISRPQPSQMQGPHKTDLRIQSSHFFDIAHNLPLLGIASNQTLLIEDTNFSNIQPDLSLCDVSAYSSEVQWGNGNLESCSYLLACDMHSSCGIEDSCQSENDNIWLLQ